MSDGPFPSKWALSTIGEVCEPPQYGWTTSASSIPGNVRLLRATDISQGGVDWDTVPWCKEEPARLGRYAVQKNDLLITRTGAGVGRAFLMDEGPLSVFASYLIRFIPSKEINPRYLRYFLDSPKYWASIAMESAGIAQPNVNAKKLAAVTTPIAPRKQQDRIVAEIEKQFSRLDAATAALKRVQANLKLEGLRLLLPYVEEHPFEPHIRLAMSLFVEYLKATEQGSLEPDERLFADTQRILGPYLNQSEESSGEPQ
jgi:type I restriction enzyme S subunit